MSNVETIRAVHQMLDESPGTTAILSVHGDCLSGIMDALNQRDLQLPRDLSLILIASGKQCDAVYPGVTRIDLPAEMMGYRAAQALIQQIKGQQIRTVQSLIPPQLVAGNTTDVITKVNGNSKGEGY
jgi:LacI family transcriptional regulator